MKENVNKLFGLVLKVNVGENMKYKVKANKNSVVFTKATKGQSSKLYYLVS